MRFLNKFLSMISVATLVLMSVAANVALADTVEPPNFNATSPEGGSYEFSLYPGESVESGLLVTNLDPTYTITVQPDFETWLGSPSIPKSWVDISTQLVEIPPLESVTIPFSLSLPDDAGDVAGYGFHKDMLRGILKSFWYESESMTIYLAKGNKFIVNILEEFPCEGLDCPCEGPDCPCEGPDCPCEGPDCPCEGPDCPCEGPECPCEGPDCPCEGPDCPCEGPDCPCEGPDCPCEGPDCPEGSEVPPYWKVDGNLMEQRFRESGYDPQTMDEYLAADRERITKAWDALLNGEDDDEEVTEEEGSGGRGNSSLSANVFNYDFSSKLKKRSVLQNSLNKTRTIKKVEVADVNRKPKKLIKPATQSVVEKERILTRKPMVSTATRSSRLLRK